ncbi:MAG: rRNA adenine N-6-methyltransferase family protein, partial [Promethearchaeota archaeon]
MPFFSKPELQDQLVQLGIRLDKKRGQCFLIDENIIRLTVKNANLRLKQDIVIEIGPGLGPLSDYLIEQSKRVFLIEFDKKIAQFLFSYYKSQFQHESQVLFLEDPKKKDYQNLPEDCKVIIIHGDALKVPFPRATKIVSNIPYQIS